MSVGRAAFDRCHSLDRHFMRRVAPAAARTAVRVRTRSWVALAGAVLPLLAHAQSGIDETNRQRMNALSAHVRQVSQATGATLARGSQRMIVFGPEATLAFYTLDEPGGTQQQRMAVIETQTDTSRGEAGPPLRTPNLTFKRYPTKQVVVGDARIGGKGRTLDVAQAKVSEESVMGLNLSATVTVPVVGTTAGVPRTASFRISHPVRAEKATIVETGQ